MPMNPYLTDALGILSANIGGAQRGGLGRALGTSSLQISDARRLRDEEARKKKEREEAKADKEERKQALLKAVQYIDQQGGEDYGLRAQQAYSMGDTGTLGKLFQEVYSPDFKQLEAAGYEGGSSFDRARLKQDDLIPYKDEEARKKREAKDAGRQVNFADWLKKEGLREERDVRKEGRGETRSKNAAKDRKDAALELMGVRNQRADETSEARGQQQGQDRIERTAEQAIMRTIDDSFYSNPELAAEIKADIITEKAGGKTYQELLSALPGFIARIRAEEKDKKRR